MNTYSFPRKKQVNRSKDGESSYTRVIFDDAPGPVHAAPGVEFIYGFVAFQNGRRVGLVDGHHTFSAEFVPEKKLQSNLLSDNLNMTFNLKLHRSVDIRNPSSQIA